MASQLCGEGTSFVDICAFLDKGLGFMGLVVKTKLVCSPGLAKMVEVGILNNALTVSLVLAEPWLFFGPVLPPLLVGCFWQLAGSRLGY